MITLNQILQAAHSADFKQIVKNEIQNLDPNFLPLQQGLSLSSYVSSSPFSVVVLKTTEEENLLKIKTAIFYTGIISGCSCSDDPTPTDEQNEYCELLFSINKATANTEVKLLDSR